MVAFLIGVHVFTCIALILIVLLQPGNKQGMGAALGGGGAQTVFGGRGANTFLSKLTAGAAIVFMVNSLILVWVSSNRGSVTDAIVKDQGAAAVTAEESAEGAEAAPPAGAVADEEAPAAAESSAEPEGEATPEAEAAPVEAAPPSGAGDSTAAPAAPQPAP